jgi:hypothetical protein
MTETIDQSGRQDFMTELDGRTLMPSGTAQKKTDLRCNNSE